ncbi:uncharacterized protein N7479_009527 [Penicillium vulpinum]|uniref:uncharacterized protein n=1 Tax=Penicillium vulpinum TaxID=29845 RepID=UPI002549B0F3|nr:uncharacterized protein N7479_009527 [Penicillium vulpinum]KAJ5951114.1 hypothetical protein N7479_009527 [Penicillium vulpinum]
MSQSIPRASWLSLFMVALLAVSTVNAHPISQTDKDTEQRQVVKLESRSPVSHPQVILYHLKNTLLIEEQRLITDTQNYVHDILQGLGLEDPTPTAAPTASIETTQQQNPENTKPTHMTYSDSNIYAPSYDSNGVGFTQTVKTEHSNNRPVENVQVGHGWRGGDEITPEDFPFIFETMARELGHRFKNMVDSSDEVGLAIFL